MVRLKYLSFIDTNGRSRVVAADGKCFMSTTSVNSHFNLNNMAERTTVNVGEPADETPVDGCNNRPQGNFSEGGDQEGGNFPETSFKINSGDFNERLDKLFPDLDSVNRPEFHSFYDEQQDDPHSSASADHDWNDKNSEDFQITKADVCYKIIPLIGAVSYEYFSLKIMNPSWFLSAFSGIDQRVSNVLWMQSQLGIGLYIYSRQHIQPLTLSRRVLYSVFGSLMFNYGSCLFWALGKSYLPRDSFLRVGFGLLSGGVLLAIGREYLNHVDKLCSDQID